MASYTDDPRKTVALPIRISLNTDQQQKQPTPPPRRVDRYTPQESVNRFWSKFYAKFPGKVFTVLPENPYAQKIATTSKGVAQAQRAVRSYEQAREECIRDVKRIIKECRRTNQKYRDPHFDLESDLKKRNRYCLDGLRELDEDDRDYHTPKAVKRVTDIFENPQFFIHGPTAGDVIQGRSGDCYLMAALCGLGNMEGLIDKTCVIQDQTVGVYGFVFHRDGEWQQCIVDDQLYLLAPDYDDSIVERTHWETIDRRDNEEEYRKIHQVGSRALYFAKCSDQNETWLPLLQKAYAKAHGDYAAIAGGWTGEAIEDLTGGVTSEIYPADILDRDEFWKNEILKVGKEFLYGCSTGLHADWLEPHRPRIKRQGIIEQHAYSIMEAVEHIVDGKTYRLVKVRNPWGKQGWSGAWSDGSAEWTAQWMERLNHRFGDDGTFWMSYEDLLRKYQRLDRTRIFGPDWRITQQWTSVHVPWSADYHQTRFAVTVTRTTPTVIVLSQLDSDYFAGLDLQYTFKLQFRVQKVGDEEDYIVRSNQDYYTYRSVSTEITLEAGSYFVLMKVTATRIGGPSVDKVISLLADDRREKLIQVGLSYDVAHAKGVIVETEKEKYERELSEKAEAAALREKRKNEVKALTEERWRKNKKHRQRRKMRAEKHERRVEEKAAARRANGASDGHAYDEKDLLPRSEQDTSASGTAAVSGGQSFTGELIASYERSEDPSPTTPETRDTSGTAPANGIQNNVALDNETMDKAAAQNQAKDHPPTPKVQINGVDAVTDVRPLKRRPAPLGPSATLEQRVDEPGQAERYDRRQTAQWSDSDSDSEFDWQTDLDYDSDDSRIRGAQSQPPRRDGDRSKRERPERGEEDEKDDEEGEQPEPWNAVCVVGLRVYSKDPDLSLEVVRPNRYSDKLNQDVGGTLDRDDPAKGAVADKWAKTPIRETFD